MSSGRYHHGDLREALIAAAIALLAERPVEEVGLREVAREVGVSAAAPYRHFEGREALLTAVAARGFLALAARLRRVRARGSRRLPALARAYIGFALENRNLADLMLRRPGPVAEDPDLAAAAEAAYAPLREAVAEICGRPARDETVGAWALVHGLSMLAADTRLAADLRERRRLDRLVARVTAAYARGIAAEAAAGMAADEERD